MKHYFKIAFRNLARQKVLAAINIFGLSIGLATFSLFLLYAINEFNYDRFHTDAKNIYRVHRWKEAFDGEKAGGDTYMPMPLGPALKQDFPEVKEFVRIKESWGENLVKIGNDVVSTPVYFADPSFFTVFTFPFKYGNPAQALSDLHSIVLTEDAAMKLFGTDNPIGRRMEIKIEDEFDPFTVTGVCYNVPSNSSLNINVIGNFSYLETIPSGKKCVNNWHRSSFQTYVQLQSGSSLPSDKKRLLDFYNKYYPEEEKELRKSVRWKGKGSPVYYGMRPIRTTHTDTEVVGGEVDSVNPQKIWILLGIAFGVLLIACINFTTLSIGRSAGRAKEVGIRKVVGSNFKNLVMQFLSESMLLTILSAVIGIALAILFLPFFNSLAGSKLQFSVTQYPELIWLLVLVTFFAGIISGCYPSFVLSAFKPTEVLKKKYRVGGSNFFTRSLVTFQFILSAGLIMSTIIIMQQLRFMRTKNPGFNKENVLMVDIGDVDANRIYPVFRQTLLSNSQVKNIAASEIGLGEGMGWSRTGFEFEGKHKDVYEYYVTGDYLDVLGLHLIAGRKFNPAISSDTVNSVIVNESLLKDFGWTTENAVDKKITGYIENSSAVIVGVVKDFNFRPLSEKIEPQLFHSFRGGTPRRIFVRIKPGDPSAILTSMSNEWKKIAPGFPFKYTFLDESLDRFYKSEIRWAKITGWAGGISIFLACLGLFGLAALSVINRTKEIGIRKILGAPLTSIVNLLSREFVKLVVLALIIATPLSWFIMNHWLENFAYRIDIRWWVFLFAGLTAIVIALLTIGIHALRAALSNPVKSLRTE